LSAAKVLFLATSKSVKAADYSFSAMAQ